MNNHVLVTKLLMCAIVVLPFNSSVAQEDIRSKKHPIIGYWVSEAQEAGCQETYQFNEDGSGYFTSGEEQLEIKYVVEAQPDETGFFKLTHQVVKTNGKSDCTKNVTQSNSSQVSYLLFQPDGYSYVACENNDTSLENCFGPMQLKVRAKPD